MKARVVQALLDAAQPGDTVIISDGNIEGPVTLNAPNVSVRGPEPKAVS